MNQFYVHVRLFEATAEQAKKFEEIMLTFLYQKTIKESDESCCRLAPEGYILKSTMNCQQIVDQTFAIANSAGVNANIFVCKFEQSACLLPSAALVGNDFVYPDLTPKPLKLDS
ncbi:hypothetical protein ACUXKK_004372 [Klebsiella aerogenes]|uniref:YmfI family phage protein n=1 Tax=Klebsiella pneumoniae TaxID=573 RepID=UPI001C7EDE44|nr:hypothetical protein [Klebsiella pneumoniae]MBX4744241.1 hypothetical protein [Klebsiella pneumoniae]